jgi:NAD(P)-dependent dehydrogenase (short-subunit alcohol dehydrogenase family)
MRHIMITGASTGIGRACVASAIARGYQAVASVRTAADATSLSTEFGTHVTPIIMDVTDSASISQAAAVVSDLLQKNTNINMIIEVIVSFVVSG